MAEQHLDYNARRISVRRHYNLSLDAEGYDSARSSDVEDDVPEDYESLMEFGRSPGAVPFFWERAPGVAKPEIARARDARGVSAVIGNLRPPPAGGRSFAPVSRREEDNKAVVRGKAEKMGVARKEEEEEQEEEQRSIKGELEIGEAEEKLVERVKPACKGKSPGPRGRKQLEPAEEVASTRAFAERVASRSFFGEIALSAISDTVPRGWPGASPARAARGSRSTFGSSGSSNLFFESPTANCVPLALLPDHNGVKMQHNVHKDDTDLFADASDSFPRTSYVPSPVNGLREQLHRRTETDPDTREYILRKFLPAAGALVAEGQVERAAADRERGSRDHSSSPQVRVGFSPQQGVHSRLVPKNVAVKQTSKLEPEEEEDDDEVGHVSVLASKMGCGLLPRVMGRALRHTATPCFLFRSRAKAKNVARIRCQAPYPAGSTTFEDDSQFDDAYSEFWDEDEEEEFLDQRLMEVREMKEQLKFSGRNLPIGASPFEFNQKAAEGMTMVAVTSPSSADTNSSLVVRQAGHACLDKASERSDFSSSTEPSVDNVLAVHFRDNPTVHPVHHDARGFLGLPRTNRAPEPELVPRRAAAYREYFHHEPRTSSGKGCSFPTAKDVGELQGRSRLEDFLRLERWNQPEAKDMDVQTWVNHTAGHVEGKEVGTTLLSLSEEAEHTHSGSSSGEPSICGSDGLSFTSDPKSSDMSSGTCVSADQEDPATKGWPLSALQTYQHRKWPEKESPVSVLPNSVPPLPPSPAQSWLWANLAASPLHPQKGSQLVLLKKNFEQGGPANSDTKWQLVVQSENSRQSDRLRFSEELRDTGLLVGGDIY